MQAGAEKAKDLPKPKPQPVTVAVPAEAPRVPEAPHSSDDSDNDEDVGGGSGGDFLGLTAKTDQAAAAMSYGPARPSDEDLANFEPIPLEGEEEGEEEGTT